MFAPTIANYYDRSIFSMTGSLGHRSWREVLVRFSDSDTQTLENAARGKIHQNFAANFTTPLAEKNGESFHSTLLQAFCSDKVEHFGSGKGECH